MEIDFDFASFIVLQKEGGFQDDHDDSGNWTGGKIGVGLPKGTKYGISAAAYPHLDIKNLTKEDSIRIYKEDYWDACGANMVPERFRLHVFDMAVNAGPATAIKILQRAALVDDDGKIGPKTLSAIPSTSVQDYTTERIKYYEAIVKKNPIKRKYLKGWKRRALDIERITLEALKK